MKISWDDPNTIFMLLIATLGILSWRYIGVILFKKIRQDSIVAKFVNAIAYGMTTAIVFKMILFPTSVLKLIPITERLIPFLLGIVVFLYLTKNPNIALLSGVGSFTLLIIYRNYL